MPHQHPQQEAGSSRCWGPREPEAGVQLPCGDPAQEPMSCRSRSALLSSERSLRLKPQDMRPHPDSTHAPRWGTPAPTPTTCVILVLSLKGQKGLSHHGKARTLGAEPVCCRKSIKCCGVKMHSQPFSVSPRILCTGRRETHREVEGVSPRPQTAPAGAPPCTAS